MKFAEHLSAHITPEWRKQYIQYEVRRHTSLTEHTHTHRTCGLPLSERLARSGGLTLPNTLSQQPLSERSARSGGLTLPNTLSQQPLSERSASCRGHHLMLSQEL
ncbi:Hypothetical predicted protein [Pelobates cultripes]|uniref:SPX domain-containing protein n=1 Tax=Pelobates cultripes TaxID=61616 RepID=A0AAD1ST72_PELCU|nr:Hypothetical predicted protein [Pelobates cultripes]